MVKILLVTGRLAEPIVREAVIRSNTTHEVDIVVAPIDVAVFLTPSYIAEYLKSRGISGEKYDLVIIPGAVKGSCKIIEDVIGVKVVKGTINAYDLSELLRLKDLEILSKEKSADEVLQDLIMKKNLEILLSLEEKAVRKGISVGNIAIPIVPPPIRIATEIAFTHRHSQETLIKTVSRAIDDGADIISLGFEALEPHPDNVFNVIKLIKKEFDVAIAIDTSIPSEIIKGVEAGCDMIINIDILNIEHVEKYLRDIAVVIVPRDPCTGIIPSEPDLRVELIAKTIDKLNKIGVEKIIADTILNPPGSIFTSLLAYNKFKKLYPHIPMLMGIGNVIELMDVDSIGLNALLVELAQEIGASIILTSEHSAKARGSTREAKIAMQMMAIAATKKIMPKDLGLSLLILKDKKKNEFIINKEVEEIVIASNEEMKWDLDPTGIFKINVNHDEGYIEALYIGRKGKILIKGKSARAIRNEIMSKGLVSSLSHALYIGVELGKAEEALRLGKNYSQEHPLFILPEPIDIKRLDIKEAS